MLFILFNISDCDVVVVFDGDKATLGMLLPPPDDPPADGLSICVAFMFDICAMEVANKAALSSPAVTQLNGVGGANGDVARV